jgi:hypothetical protein
MPLCDSFNAPKLINGFAGNLENVKIATTINMKDVIIVDLLVTPVCEFEFTFYRF